MGEVIQVSFNPKDNCGYSFDEDRKVTGVFVQKVAAMVTDDKKTVIIGEQAEQGIYNGIEIPLEKMNEFCLMWLMIFDESKIKEGVL